jgi:protein O-mannosyl-transferase
MKQKPRNKIPPVQVKKAPDLLKDDVFSDRRIHLLILILVSFGFYFNSIFNEYVLDDMIVITHNSFTKKGFDGIKDILLHDSFLGFTGMENQLAGGRYRPLSIITFAIEYGFFGMKPQISHFINVVLYACLSVLLYNFLTKYVFRGKPLYSFLAVLIFAIHPVHTEVVANIKSRDELMSMIFTFLAMDSLLTHILRRRSFGLVALSMLYFFLSLMSKENGLVYIAILPLILYFFHDHKLGKAVIWAFPFIGVLVVYMIIRIKLTGFKMVENGEVLNAPFLYATKAQAFATKITMLGKYLLMLLYPYKLSYDYSYNQIRYINPSDARFLLSFLVNAGLIVYALVAMGKRSIISFCILFYFANMSLVTNIFFEVGTSFADRFLFQPSLALGILAAYYLGRYLYRASEAQLLKRKKVLLAITCFLVFVCGVRVVARNLDWKNEASLFISDVKACPNSAKTNNNCGVALINLSAAEANETRKKQLLNEAIEKIQKSVNIHPGYVDAYLNLGVAHSRLLDVDNTEAAWVKARQLSPAHPKLVESFMVLSDLCAMQGFKANQAKDYQNAIKYYTKAIEHNGRNIVDYYYNLGGNYLMLGDVEKARELWKKTLEMKPDHPDARKWLDEISKSR